MPVMPAAAGAAAAGAGAAGAGAAGAGAAGAGAAPGAEAVTVIANGVVVPMEPEGVVFDAGWVRVRGSRIDAVGAGPAPIGSGDRVIDAAGGLVLPGLISTHQHLLDTLLRGGLVTGPTFVDWLLGLYYAGMSAYTPDDCGLASLLGAVETVRSGVTCVVDNWGVDNGSDPSRVRDCAEASIAALSSSGLRVIWARMFATRLPPAWSAVPVGYDVGRLITGLDQAFAAIDSLMSAHPGGAGQRLRICPAPELPEMVEPEAFAMAMDLAARHDTIVPMHLLASLDSRAAFPAAAIDALGGLGPRLLGAHCTAATDHDVALLAERQVKVAHCPTSNAFGGRMAPLPALVTAGITVGLGSDNATLNCNSDILAEARRAVLTARVLGAPADVVTPARAMRMATIDGARAVGLADSIGSITPGKRADLIIVDTAGAHWWPRHDWITTLVFQGKSSDVRTVMVDGDLVMEDRVLRFLDPDEELRMCRAVQVASDAIVERAALA
jgi:5-methylthioadenosine/S-adenosylhomocysteine deaminase